MVEPTSRGGVQASEAGGGGEGDSDQGDAGGWQSRGACTAMMLGSGTGAHPGFNSGTGTGELEAPSGLDEETKDEGGPDGTSGDIGERRGGSSSSSAHSQSFSFLSCSKFRLSYYPHRLESFKEILRASFFGKCEHNVYGDFKQYSPGQGDVPCYFIHVVKKTT
ncbi:hypothetical protein cypCar_00043812 [Cyprinus carpio]|nr:hypothetical protein cypCar_00043812 [Cyprinus carpio]